MTPDATAAIAHALGGEARGRHFVVAERNGVRVSWEIVSGWTMTLLEVTLDPRYPIALRIVDGEVTAAEPAQIMTFLLDDELRRDVRRYPNTQIGTSTVDDREVLRLSREGPHADVEFVVGAIDVLVRVASRLEEAYHLGHAGPYR